MFQTVVFYCHVYMHIVYFKHLDTRCIFSATYDSSEVFSQHHVCVKVLFFAVEVASVKKCNDCAQQIHITAATTCQLARRSFGLVASEEVVAQNVLKLSHRLSLRSVGVQLCVSYLRVSVAGSDVLRRYGGVLYYK